MSKIRAAVIGCGAIAMRRHIIEYADIKEVELVAFCDINLERAEGYVKEYGGKAYQKWEDVVALPDVDCVSVCLPNYLHAPVTIAALKAGKHVLCEKPMATSHEEALAMIAASKESGKFLMIGHNQRIAPLHVKAKELLHSGVIGKLLTFETEFSHPGPESWSVDGKDSWFFDKKQAFIGAMGDLGVHKADLMQWMLEDDIDEVSAFVVQNAKDFGDVDDNAVCILKTKSGVVGTLKASWSHIPGADNATYLYGTKGRMTVGDESGYSVIVTKSNWNQEFYKIGELQTNEEGGQTNTDVVNKFVKSILTNTPPEISGEEGYRALAVILACLESSESGKHVKVRYEA